MKVQVVIEDTVARSIASRYDLPKFQSALDADYNKGKVDEHDVDGLGIRQTGAGIKSAKGKEAKGAQAHGSFQSKDSIEITREGRLTMPRRWIAWLVAWQKFVKGNGVPSGEMEFTVTQAGLVTHPVIPASLLLWLETSFRKDDSKPADKPADAPSDNGQRNRNKGPKVQAPSVPA